MPTTSPRILLVSTDKVAPATTGSGNQAIRWGLIEGLAAVGALPAFYAAADLAGRKHLFAEARDGLRLGDERFWCGPAENSPDAASELRKAADDFEPDVVLAYGTGPLRLSRAAGIAVPTGIMSVDLEHLPLLYRHVYNLHHGRWKQKVKSLLLTPRQLLLARGVLKDMRTGYRLADFVINHARHHADWHGRTHGLPVLYAPNPVSPLSAVPLRSPQHPPRFSLVGGIGGIATLTGLAWFAYRVYPLIEPAILAGELEVHLVGKGVLDPGIDRRLKHVVRRGFVDDLTSDLGMTTAVIVPTPINLGFRTRIVDAFRHGVTVVAHSANAVGMPELEHERNALLVSDARSFAAAILKLARNPEVAERLGAQALSDFDSRFSATIVARRILNFIHQLPSPPV